MRCLFLNQFWPWISVTIYGASTPPVASSSPYRNFYPPSPYHVPVQRSEAVHIPLSILLNLTSLHEANNQDGWRSSGSRRWQWLWHVQGWLRRWRCPKVASKYLLKSFFFAPIHARCVWSITSDDIFHPQVCLPIHRGSSPSPGSEGFLRRTWGSD